MKDISSRDMKIFRVALALGCGFILIAIATLTVTVLLGLTPPQFITVALVLEVLFGIAFPIFLVVLYITRPPEQVTESKNHFYLLCAAQSALFWSALAGVIAYGLLVK
jgi:hypothetical protein